MISYFVVYCLVICSLKMKYLFFTAIILSITDKSFNELLLEYKWKYADLLWESSEQKQEAIDSGKYNASLMYLFDVDVGPDDRLFVTAIREKGAPVSVMTITDQEGEGGALLRPYPDWSWYKDDCKGITGGVYRVDIQCDHLFIVASGKLGEKQLCPPELLIFNLLNDKLVKRVIIPYDIAFDKKGIGFLSSPVVFAPHCKNIKDNAVVFMSDTDGFGLVVYDASTSKFCRYESESKKPSNTGFTLANQFTPLEDGIFGMAVVQNKDLYYTAFAGSKIYKTEISKIKGCSLNDANALNKLAATLPGQTGSIASADCAIFFSDIEQTSIMCADTTKEINSQNMEIVEQDFETLQFPSGLKNRGGELVILSNRYQHHLHSTLNTNEINFRLLSTNNTDIQKKTNCFASCEI
ncbi:major royal jelly protein 1-like [Linepithema humile]|uniref:major royal jelly protein 1-like n=1 Tax=Linepithema humile TaxID=83485 RepID=UPI00351E016F